MLNCVHKWGSRYDVRHWHFMSSKCDLYSYIIALLYAGLLFYYALDKDTRPYMVFEVEIAYRKLMWHLWYAS